MPRFVGLDVHKRIVEVCILAESGDRVWRGRVPCTREGLGKLIEQQLEADDQLVLEATTNTWAVVDLLTPAVAKVVVSNPLRTKAIASAKVKTDKVDARVLAELLRCDFLPEVWQPDAETRRLRSLTHRRASLVGDRTAVKNRLHSTLAQRLIVVPYAKLFSLKGLAWLRKLEIDEDGRQMLDSDLRMLESIAVEITALEAILAPLAYRRDQVRLLMTLPGVHSTTAQALMAAWGDIYRFPDPDRAASYLGLVPSTRQSASRCYHGRITKQGNSHARWLLVQAAQHVAQHPGPLGVFFRRLMKKKGRNVAVVATARKLATIAWHLLRNNEPYRYAMPLTTQTKLTRLRVQATGKRRRRGPTKGQPRAATYGSGQRTRRLPSLPEIYQSEQLPAAKAPKQLPTGERKALRALGVATFVEDIQQARRVPKAQATAQS